MILFITRLCLMPVAFIIPEMCLFVWFVLPLLVEHEPFDWWYRTVFGIMTTVMCLPGSLIFARYIWYWGKKSEEGPT
jgi:hypothetical protein